MKKQLLITSALFITIGALAQTNQLRPKPNGIINMAHKVEAKFAAANSSVENEGTAAKSMPGINTPVSPEHPSTELSINSSPIIAAPWTRISGSYNILGMIVSSSKPLQYNRYIDAVSFIQRRSTTYVTSPAFTGSASSGPIVAMLGKDCGNLWDSVLVYGDQVNWSRYPQGGIYSPQGNQNYNAAYAVAMGPVTAGSGWVGSYYASKSMTPTVQKNAPGIDQQFMSHQTPWNSAASPTMKKHYFPRYGFSQNDDGRVYSLGGLYDEYGVVTAGQPEKFRGALLAKGNFASGVMVWTPDSMVPPTVSITTGGRQLFSQPYMAWNDAGTVGYVMFIGGRTGSTGSNFGWQPIIYKTTNSGSSWVLVNGIDFNTPSTFDFVLNSMNPVNTNPTLTIPFFNVGEGIDVAVDKNNKLHIGTTVVGTARNHPDSMGYTYQFPKGTENMSWPYVNTAWPYIFDFIGDGSPGGWSVKTIDSVGTEGPSATSGQPGFGSNPWANQSQATPQASDMRIQLSRTYDGEFILYSWAESDTLITTAATKWNEFPNLKVKALRVCDMAVSKDKYTVSSPATGFNPRVRDKSYFHFMSRQSRGGASTLTTAQFTVPLTVSNNVACNGDNPIDTYFGRVIVSYSFATAPCGATLTTGINNATTSETSRSRIYPNPTTNSFNVDITLDASKEISIDIYNAIGQKVSTIKVNGQVGDNTVKMDMEGVNSGVYFVKIKSGRNESTKKLIIE